jgi:hypothetical protein
MPFIVIKSNGQEIDRRVLSGATVIGRAPDCDVAVRDILLSRRHCRFEESGEVWLLTDLQSKNGTIVNGERIEAPIVLMDNDIIRLGRSKITFSLAQYDLEADLGGAPGIPDRPADPSDSLSGTLSGFTLLMPGETEASENMPCPQPRPRDPVGLIDGQLQELLSAIASSSWDSIYAEARQSARARPMPNGVEESRPRPKRPRSPIDLSLQAPTPEIERDDHAANFDDEIFQPPIETIPAETEKGQRAKGTSNLSTPAEKIPRRIRLARPRENWRQTIAAVGAAACFACVFILSRDWTEKSRSAGSTPRSAFADTVRMSSPMPLSVQDRQERLAAEILAPTDRSDARIEPPTDPLEDALSASLNPFPSTVSPNAPKRAAAHPSPAATELLSKIKSHLNPKDGNTALKVATSQCLRMLWR